MRIGLFREKKKKGGEYNSGKKEANFALIYKTNSALIGRDHRILHEHVRKKKRGVIRGTREEICAKRMRILSTPG